MNIDKAVEILKENFITIEIIKENHIEPVEGISYPIPSDKVSDEQLQKLAEIAVISIAKELNR